MIPALSDVDSRLLKQGNKSLKKVRTYLEMGRRPTRGELVGEDQDIKLILRRWDQLRIYNGIVYRQGRTGPQGKKVLELLVPKSLRDKALAGIHDDVGHSSLSRSLDIARSRFYWPGIAADVERWIKSCKACVMHKAPQPLKAAPLVSITTTEPMELVCIDYLKL